MKERQFIPGSQWLYLKIYTGVKTADIILEEALQPLVEYLQENSYISKWFFIRYNDPKPHLRIRLSLEQTMYGNEILDRFKLTLEPFIKSGEISNLVIDTYRREIERYGENTMEDAETLFWLNSEYTLDCLTFSDEEKIEVSLFYIDEILNKLQLTAREKLEWVQRSEQAFKQEFNADKKLNSQLDKKYREFKPRFQEFIHSEEFAEERERALSHIEKGKAQLQHIIYHDKNGCLGMPLPVFFQSLFHMNINRLFVSVQRVFEMVIYDFLVRYYKTEVYKVKQN
ncbi:thiopeptide-type bacteriocin biosynthesis protein [Chryseobacterium sp. CT-SW4]|uniref:thiopeptide-type bacteriocin biosynthesis protein n=1 Tax=Chryseobacterium sp. SW-1 TaxID=3157343 RepID=UPI003B027EAC